MGVPALFRWLSLKYPKIISPVIEENPEKIDDREVPVDTTKPNPNGEEMDNLYLDMNGIVHPCSHPEDKPAPENEEEMMLEIFSYTDRIVNMCRPRKLLYLAVDGVAPRAKMNQQRARRFRTSQEVKETEEKRAEYLELLRAHHKGVLPESMSEEMQKKTWDSNVITPGTPFMDTLSISLKYWTAYKLNTDPMWKDLKVILSDASVPGEGEHKIMEFIRSQRRCQQHDPNTRHVICGLDADLIMLGLATHEPHFRVLREDVFFESGKPRLCRICGQTGHYTDQCRGEIKLKQGKFDEKAKVPAKRPWIWLHVAALREYLAIEMQVPNQPFKFDLERAIDDWVFMCFFVGNDFLPHLPSLDIRHEGIDTLIAIWRDNVFNAKGYVTKDGFVDIERVQHILSGLAKQESAIFKRRHEAEMHKEAQEAAKLEKIKRRKMADEGQRGRSNYTQDQLLEATPGIQMYDSEKSKTYTDFLRQGSAAASRDGSNITHDMVMKGDQAQDANDANKSAAAVLRERMKSRGSNGSTPNDAEVEMNETTTSKNDQGEEAQTQSNKRKRDDEDDEDEEEAGTPGRDSPKPHNKSQPDPVEAPEDDVRLWEPGYHDRYYEQKFHVAADDHEFPKKVARSYIEGLAWVLLYYFQGCPSWNWYYPYHYAPFAVDFEGITDMDLKFDKGTPFTPFEQLMGVLPPASNHAIPEAFRTLMTDEDSEIKDFYPEVFPVDMNGKKLAWLGIAILPFIDEKRLLKAMAERHPFLSDDERKRNEPGHEILFFSDTHTLYEEVGETFYSKKQETKKLWMDAQSSKGLLGYLEKNEDYIPQSALIYPLETSAMPDVEVDHSINLYYEMPTSEHVHKSMLLRGAVPPPKALTPEDEAAARESSFRTGRSFGGAPLRDGNYRGRGRGRINYGDHGRNNFQSRTNEHDQRPNPFAPHLNPSFFPNGPPPPNPNGWAPPPMAANFPQQFGRGNGPPGPPRPPFPQNGNYGRGGYHQQHQSPPHQRGPHPPNGHRGRGNHRGGYGHPQGGRGQGGHRY